MDQLYPASPDVVVDELTAPGPTYKRRARIALLSLLLFIGLYLALTGWFGWTAYHYFSNATESTHGPLIGFGLAGAAAFLTVFLVKALFFVNRGGEIDDLEVTADEQPQLFAFLHRLADEAGAPRPHRVFLSGRVNAAVFYDLTLLNLFFPSKKNLEIGLALVNGLNLGEFKAVLAHEFGHFRQGSMAVGRWVYVAQQIANHIVYQRDIIDRFLVGLSRFDLRVAWIGWILRLIVWALRAILDTAFGLVILAQRSLSREMEFHADMVSVSLTGSDALVHALHRLGAADDAWSRALGVAGQEMAAGRAVTDVFVIQKIISGRMKDILDDENHDLPPPLPADNRDTHRVFDTEAAHPPRMWSTHPPNRDREENAKKQYIAAAIDERPAWEVFTNQQALREQMTAHLLQSGSTDAELTKSPLTETVASVNEMYSKVIYDRRYRGTYMGRSVVREFSSAQDVFQSVGADRPLVEQFQDLYPETLSDKFEEWRNLEEERATLRAIRDGQLESPDGVIRHRGVVLKRRDLPEAIKEMREECDVARRELCDHDCLVRSTHSDAAKKIGNGWYEYHAGLVRTLHYADHTAANLSDVQGRLTNLWSVVIADGKVSSGEAKQLLEVARDLYGVLQGIDRDAADVSLSSDLLQSLNTSSWRALLNEEFTFPDPSKENLGDWLSAVDSWIGYFLGALGALQSEALELLLAAEARIESAACDGTALPAAPTTATVPGDYPVLLPNTERKLQTRLGLWDRFQTADGLFPGLARFGVATAIVGGLLGLGVYMESTVDVTFYNGLATKVSVEAGGENVVLGPLSHHTMSVDALADLQIDTRSGDGMLIESVEVDASNAFGAYVYNVASAAPLIQWRAVYGAVEERPPVYLGAENWQRTDVDHIFSEPPDSINTSGSGGSRTALNAFDDFDPRYLANYFPADAATDDVVRAHAKWDHQNSTYTVLWLGLAAAQDDFQKTVAHRLQRDEFDILALRNEQDYAVDDSARNAVCQRHEANAARDSENVAWRYLTIRCMPDGPQQASAFIDAHVEAPSFPWLAGAAGYSYAESGQWAQSAAAFDIAYEQNPGMRVVYADDIARVRRMVEGESSDASDLALYSPWLHTDLLVRAPEQPSDPLLVAYWRLMQGDLTGALEAATADADVADRMLRIVAASDGASQQVIEQAKALPLDRGITGETFWLALGFALRHGLPTDGLLAEADDVIGVSADLARKFVANVRTPGAAERVLIGSRANERGHAYALGTVALGDGAPEQWREGAKRLLYTMERPYLR